MKEDSNEEEEVKETAPSPKNSTSSQARKTKKTKEEEEKKSAPCVAKMESEIMLRLNHGEKINALETTKSGDVIVADTSSEILVIRVYSIEVFSNKY